MNPKDFASQIEKLGALDEPVRRRLYLVVVAEQDGGMSRDAAAKAAGVTRALAAFHLDKLVEAGLLDASFRRLSGRTGPGAGRPAKLYRRSGAQLDVTLPERRYEWAAKILARALAEAESEATREALRNAARAHGEELGRDLGSSGRRTAPLHAAARALETCGFEPKRAPEGQLVLRNCPFDSLRAGCREAICGMNLALIQGLLNGLELSEVKATLEPQPDTCCVALRLRPAPEGEASPR
ncbi:MAG TPA: helix-turn-helix domain-containing protein [Candidatus Eisenbacteria bacterium]|jgi:predicted ArsR family transcriptional regulator